MANQKTNNGKQRYIPLEVKEGVVITREYEDKPVVNWKVGNRKIKAILVPATEEQYQAYMRPVWKEEKRKQRMAEKQARMEKAMEKRRYDDIPKGLFKAVSFEKMDDMEYGFEDECPRDSLEDFVQKKELLRALYSELAKLKELDLLILQMAADGFSEAAIGKEIGMSQKGVNKRKHKLFDRLREQLKAYR